MPAFGTLLHQLLLTVAVVLAGFGVGLSGVGLAYMLIAHTLYKVGTYKPLRPPRRRRRWPRSRR